MTTDRDPIDAEKERLKEYAEETHNPPSAPTTDIGPPNQEEDIEDADEDED